MHLQLSRQIDNQEKNNTQEAKEEKCVYGYGLSAETWKFDFTVTL